MKKKLSLVAFAPLLFMAACHNTDTSSSQAAKKDTSYAIIGKVTGQDSGLIYLIHRESGKQDSTALDHGYFTFKGTADTPEFCRISLDDKSISFFLENGRISMLIKKDSMAFAQISGTKTQDQYNFFQNQQSKSLNERMAQVEKAYESASDKKGKKAMDSLDKVYTALDLDQKQLVMDFTKSNPASVVSAFLIFSNFSYNFRLGQLDSLYHQLDSSVQGTYFGKQIESTIEKEKLTAIGKPAPEFTCNDANGKPVSLSSFKVKYVLLDFWASWCGPCRRENPNIVRAYHKFHDKGFDIFGVSLDETKPEWLEAIKKDGLNWTQVSDLQGWKAAPAALYGIKAIPMNFLLDKNGIIIARGLHGDELNTKLTELLH